MSLAEIRFIQKKLKEKYGNIGVIAGKYVEAGYSVNVRRTKTSKGIIDIVAIKGGEKLAIDVYDKTGVISPDIIEGVYEKAKQVNAKPILAIWGRGAKISSEALSRAKELDVKIKRF